MARWTKGEADINQQLLDGSLARVTPDAQSSELLLSAARRHIIAAKTTRELDPEGALSLAYDAARKAASSLLAHQGLRPTSMGGHLAVVSAMRSQFGDISGLKSLDRLRRRRNDAEYPDPAGFAAVTNDEVIDAIEVASDCVQTAEKLLSSGRLGIY